MIELLADMRAPAGVTKTHILQPGARPPARTHTRGQIDAHTQGYSLWAGIKLIVRQCSASKEGFLNLPHKKDSCIPSLGARGNKGCILRAADTFRAL